MLTTMQVSQGRYYIIRHVGQGGMGAVYQAQDLRLGNRWVAIKEFDPSQLPSPDSQYALQAFQQEALILSSLTHPGLTAVYDYFLEDNNFYLVMEFVEGETLQQVWERAGRRFSEEQVVVWAKELCDVLNYLHNEIPAIIFRDLKPGNIMVQPNGRLKLIDFGIARLFTPGKTSDTVKFGTPGYAAPEQYGQGQTDPRSDIYALGIVIHQLLTGHDPTNTPFNLPDIASFSLPLSSGVINAVRQAVAMDPAQRPPSAHMFCEMLTKTVSTLPAPSPPVGKWSFSKGLFFLASVFLLIILLGVVSVIRTFITVPPLFSLVILWLIIASFAILIVFLIYKLPQPLALFAASFRKKAVGNDPSVSTGSVGTKPEPQINPRSIILSKPNVVNPANREVMEELILQEEFERLKGFITDATGGRFLLTGYGHFGGTSLIRGALDKARRELEERQVGNVALLVFYFNVKRNFGQESKFEIVANEFILGTLTNLGTKQKDELQRQADVVDHYEDSIPPSYRFDLTNEKSTKGKKRLPFSNATKESYDFYQLVADLNNLSNQGQKNNRLHKTISRLLDSNSLPTRIVVILDRVENLELLENLTGSGLFENKQLTVIAIARHEDYVSWPRAQQRVAAINFKEWYIPCLWQTRKDYMEHIDRVLFQKQDSVPQEIVELLYKHLEFVGRGILGNVLEELKHPKYWSSSRDGTKYLRLDALPQLHTIRHNAWLQDLLSLNWETILGNLFAGRNMAQKMDRARVGVYYLLDWIDDKTIFTIRQLVDASSNRKITISDQPEVIDEIVLNLLYVLEENRYLQKTDSGYRITWQMGKVLAPERIDPRPIPDTDKTEYNSQPDSTPQNPNDPDEKSPISLSDLKDKIARYFDLSEIENLSFDLGIDHENITGENKDTKAMKLVTYCDRHGMIENLIATCMAQRPHGSW